MPVDQNKLQEVLLQGDYLSQEDITAAEAFAKTRRIPLSEALLDKGLVTKDLIG